MTQEPLNFAIRISPVVSATTLLAALVGGTFWVGKTDHTLETMGAEVGRIADLVDAATASRWTHHMQDLWVHEANQNLKLWHQSLEGNLDADLPPITLPDPTRFLP